MSFPSARPRISSPKLSMLLERTLYVIGTNLVCYWNELSMLLERTQYIIGTNSVYYWNELNELSILLEQT
jgi:hypothetical protein